MGSEMCIRDRRKRVIAFASKPNPTSNLISLRCYIYGDSEDSKKVSNAVRDLERFDSKEESQLEAKHFFFLLSKPSTYSRLNVYSSSWLTVANGFLVSKETVVLRRWER